MVILIAHRVCREPNILKKIFYACVLSTLIKRLPRVAQRWLLNGSRDSIVPFHELQSNETWALLHSRAKTREEVDVSAHSSRGSP